MTRRSRRKKGEGNVRYDETHRRWLASFKPTTGPRVYVTGHKGELWNQFKKRLDAAKREAEKGLTQVRGTFGSYLTTVWLPKVRHSVEPRTYESYATTANTYIVPVIGEVRLTDVSPGDIERCMAQAADNGRATRTVNYIRTVARIALNAAIKARMVERNAAALAERIKERVGAERFTVDPYTAAEIAALVAAADKVFNGSLVTLGSFLGLRRGELLGLKWNDFDESSGTLSVERQVVREDGALRVKQLKTKGSRRLLRLPGFIIERLLLHRKQQLEKRMKCGEKWIDEAFIFAARWGGPLEPRNSQRLYDGIVKEAGVRRRRLHDLRHSAASLQFERGTLDITVSKMLGHSSTRITKDVYAHVTPPMMDAAVSAMEEIFKAGNDKLAADEERAASA